VGQHETVRILITGSRSWDDRTTLWAALDEVALEHRVVVVHGAASGADRLAVEWVDNARAEDEPHPPDYTAHGAIAPLVRNGEMVAAGADLCVTFIEQCGCPRRPGPHGTHGSVDCATKAAQAGIPLRHVRPYARATR
jgi:hypothetical protein